MFTCMSSLYILDINPLLEVSFASTFPLLVGCLFALLIVSFVVQKLFDVGLFIYSFFKTKTLKMITDVQYNISFGCATQWLNIYLTYKVLIYFCIDFPCLCGKVYKNASETKAIKFSAYVFFHVFYYSGLILIFNPFLVNFCV